MTLAIPRLLAGRTIVAVDLRPFPDGRGSKAYRPVLTLDNGATLSFTVQETESQEYGVRPDYSARSRP